jgi:hypothetical protein
MKRNWNLNYDYIFANITDELRRLNMVDDIGFALDEGVIVMFHNLDEGFYPISCELLGAIESAQKPPDFWSNIEKFLTANA